jgi:hypothetical protein
MTTRWWELEFQLRPCVERLGARHTDLTICRGGAIVRGCPTPSCIMGGRKDPGQTLIFNLNVTPLTQLEVDITATGRASSTSCGSGHYSSCVVTTPLAGQLEVRCSATGSHGASNRMWRLTVELVTRTVLTAALVVGAAEPLHATLAIIHQTALHGARGCLGHSWQHSAAWTT